MLGMRRKSLDDDPYAGSDHRLSSFVQLGLYALILLALATVFALSQFRGLREPLAMESAQIARHLAQGRGFVTDCVRPFDRWFLQYRERQPPVGDPIPVLWMPPGFPFLQSIGLRLLSPDYVVRGGAHIIAAERFVLVPIGIVLFLVSVLSVWLLARALLDENQARLSALIYAVSYVALSGTLSGMPYTLATPLFLLSIWLTVLVIQKHTAARRWWRVFVMIFLAGLMSSFTVLTDYVMIAGVLMLVVLLMVELQRLRWLLVSIYAFVVLFVVGMWLIRNSTSGIGMLGAWPYAALRDTPLFPMDVLERSTTPVFNAYRSGMAIRAGMAQRFDAMVSGTGFARGGVMMGFFLLSLFQRSEKSLPRTLKWLAVVTAVAISLVHVAPGADAGMSWVALYPLFVILGVGAFCQALANESFFDTAVRPLLTVFLVLLCALPAGLKIIRGADSIYPPYHSAIQHFVGGVPEDSEVLLSDIPWATAWYGGCQSILLPMEPDDVEHIAGIGWGQVGGVYLTGTGHNNAPWERIRMTRQIPDYVPLQSGVGLPVGREDQLLLTREGRWQLGTAVPND